MSKEKKSESFLFEDDTYDVNIEAFSSKALLALPEDERPTAENYYDGYLSGYKKGVDAFLEIFWVIKNELAETVVHTEVDKPPFDKVFRILLNSFLTHFKEGKDLELELQKYILKLKQNKFCGNWNELTIDQIKEIFLELRRYTIQVYEIVLEEYRKDKAKYDEELKKQLDWRNSGYRK